jgi:hypothetical protein|tara:strand:+ start:570 stop:722 length:153 start_codon:yes stop_codon:yes gene_type:complete
MSRVWRISIGLYPGILIGIRSYDLDEVVSHVLYLPFVDIALEIIKQDKED